MYSTRVTGYLERYPLLDPTRVFTTAPASRRCYTSESLPCVERITRVFRHCLTVYPERSKMFRHEMLDERFQPCWVQPETMGPVCTMSWGISS
jgi:hypothetical protein